MARDLDRFWVGLGYLDMWTSSLDVRLRNGHIEYTDCPIKLPLPVPALSNVLQRKDFNLQWQTSTPGKPLNHQTQQCGWPLQTEEHSSSSASTTAPLASSNKAPALGRLLNNPPLLKASPSDIKLQAVLFFLSTSNNLPCECRLPSPIHFFSHTSSVGRSSSTLHAQNSHSRSPSGP